MVMKNSLTPFFLKFKLTILCRVGTHSRKMKYKSTFKCEKFNKRGVPIRPWVGKNSKINICLPDFAYLFLKEWLSTLKTKIR